MRNPLGKWLSIHRLSVVADSFIAIDEFLTKYPERISDLPVALKKDFAGYDDIYEILKKVGK